MLLEKEMKFKASRGKNVQERLSTFHSEMLTAKNRLVCVHMCAVNHLQCPVSVC